MSKDDRLATLCGELADLGAKHIHDRSSQWERIEVPLRGGSPQRCITVVPVDYQPGEARISPDDPDHVWLVTYNSGLPWGNAEDKLIGTPHTIEGAVTCVREAVKATS